MVASVPLAICFSSGACSFLGREGGHMGGGHMGGGDREVVTWHASPHPLPSMLLLTPFPACFSSPPSQHASPPSQHASPHPLPSMLLLTPFPACFSSPPSQHASPHPLPSMLLLTPFPACFSSPPSQHASPHPLPSMLLLTPFPACFPPTVLPTSSSSLASLSLDPPYSPATYTPLLNKTFHLILSFSPSSPLPLPLLQLSLTLPNPPSPPIPRSHEATRKHLSVKLQGSTCP
ncbi:unnamed protein product [Closterium sp. Naga37s-1]|nr:unnamed protein product [Closterium sp. Naga37s-1]